MSNQLLIGSVFVLLHLNGWSVCSVSVELETGSVDDDRCVGGDVGLTNISILLQYRTMFQNSISEWRFLAELHPKENFNRSIGVVPQLDEGVGVQFRLLQLEHGGGRCNCWRLERMEVVLSNGTKISLSFEPPHVCHRESGNNDNSVICGRYASEARGVITRVLTYDGVITNDCPSDSRTTLISSKGSPLPASCDQMVPRM